MKKIFLCLSMIFCTALVVTSIYSMSYKSLSPVLQDTKSSYIVKDYGGKVAVFTSDTEQPVVVYEIYTHLLPENDIELLRKGILVDNDVQLIRTLEDFGL